MANKITATIDATRRQLNDPEVREAKEMHHDLVNQAPDFKSRMNVAWLYLARLIDIYDYWRQSNGLQGALFLRTANTLWHDYTKEHERVAQAKGDPCYPTAHWFQQAFAQQRDRQAILRNPRETRITWRTNGWIDPTIALEPKPTDLVDVIELDKDVTVRQVDTEAEMHNRLEEQCLQS